MSAVCNTCLETRIVEFSSPSGHNYVVKSMSALNRRKTLGIRFCEVLELRTRYQIPFERSKEVFRTVTHDSEEINQFLVNVVYDFDFAWGLTKQYPCGTGEWFHIARVSRKKRNYLF